MARQRSSSGLVAVLRKHPERNIALIFIGTVLVVAGIIFAVVSIAGSRAGNNAGNGQPDLKDCGTLTHGDEDHEEYHCFLGAMENCTPARLIMDTRYPDMTTGLPSFLITEEIQGGTMEACTFYIRYDDVFLPEGLTPLQRQAFESSASAMKGKYMSCVLPSSEINSFLENLNYSAMCQKCTGPMVDYMASKDLC
jgi:hypothetical protein